MASFMKYYLVHRNEYRWVLREDNDSQNPPRWHFLAASSKKRCWKLENAHRTKESMMGEFDRFVEITEEEAYVFQANLS